MSNGCPDLEFYQYNNVLAVRIGRYGRLADLGTVAVFDNGFLAECTAVRPFYEETVASPPPHKARVWAFIDFVPPSAEASRFDKYWWHSRGVSVGSVADGYEFVRRCGEAGMTARSVEMEVPFSRGQSAVCPIRSQPPIEGDHMFYDYPFLEVAMADVNLPSVDVLARNLRS